MRSVALTILVSILIFVSCNLLFYNYFFIESKPKNIDVQKLSEKDDKVSGKRTGRANTIEAPVKNGRQNARNKVLDDYIGNINILSADSEHLLDVINEAGQVPLPAKPRATRARRAATTTAETKKPVARKGTRKKLTQDEEEEENNPAIGNCADKSSTVVSKSGELAPSNSTSSLHSSSSDEAVPPQPSKAAKRKRPTIILPKVDMPTGVVYSNMDGDSNLGDVRPTRSTRNRQY